MYLYAGFCVSYAKSNVSDLCCVDLHAFILICIHLWKYIDLYRLILIHIELILDCIDLYRFILFFYRFILVHMGPYGAIWDHGPMHGPHGPGGRAGRAGGCMHAALCCCSMLVHPCCC